MSSPTFPSNTNHKKTRIHLSPLAVSNDGKVCHCKLRDAIISNESNKTDTSSNTKNKETYGAYKISYDDRYIPQPIRDLPAAQDAINGMRDEAEIFKKNEIDNLVEDVQEKFDLMRICVSESDLNDDRILSFARQAPKSHEAATAKAVEFVKNNALKPRWKLKRHVPKVPERVLDAPELLDDYYLNLLHWGGANCIAVGLGKTVYIWSASTGEIAKIDEPENMDPVDYVSSVHWSGSSSNSCLSVGYGSGTTRLYDVKTRKCLRLFKETGDRVPSLSWNENILSRGSRSGVIINYDVRVQHAEISRLTNAHNQEVCGLSWSHDGKYLASGGNDNQVYVWEKLSVTASSCCLRNYNSHQAAVKGIAWSPRELNVLVTGGGTADRSLNFWNVCTGSHLSTVPTNSQVSGIVWNPFVNEFVTAHGYPQNQLTLWSYPSMQVASHLISHTGRILTISLSPDGTTVASVGADETLRLWKCFEPPQKSNNGHAGDFNEKRRWGIH